MEWYQHLCNKQAGWRLRLTRPTKILHRRPGKRSATGHFFSSEVNNHLISLGFHHHAPLATCV
ncbi:hypothetical protein ENTCAN_08215 [Enterobacter cancerogenus ATCC 35316]|nr:hypothetical protein ENTCAN_08215 [Enterobacter cancerogenus ATCC 35316]